MSGCGKGQCHSGCKYSWLVASTLGFSFGVRALRPVRGESFFCLVCGLYLAPTIKKQQLTIAASASLWNYSVVEGYGWTI